MHILVLPFAAAIILSMLSLNAHADSSRPDRIRGRSIVHFGDLNIDSEQDAKVLLQRIEKAAREACDGAVDRDFEQCRKGTIARAVKKLGAPVVTRIYFQAK